MPTGGGVVVYLVQGSRHSSYGRDSMALLRQSVTLFDANYNAQHKDDVLCVAVHAGRGLGASGQKSYREGGRTRKPTIWVWGVDDARPRAGPLVFTVYARAMHPPFRIDVSNRKHGSLQQTYTPMFDPALNTGSPG